MSTRSLTTVRSAWEGPDKTGEFKALAHIYRHYDGYLEGHGLWLANFLHDLKVVNGICGVDMPFRYANGPGQLAAQLVHKLQEDGHSPDLHSDDGPCGQEYYYVIDVLFSLKGGTVFVTVYDGPMTAFGAGGEHCTNRIFSGTVSEYSDFIEDKTGLVTARMKPQKQFALKVNLDDAEELEKFMEAYEPLRGKSLANKLGFKGKGSVAAADALMNYAHNKRAGTLCRLNGKLHTATEYDKICDRIYRDDIQPFIECW